MSQLWFFYNKKSKSHAPVGTGQDRWHGTREAAEAARDEYAKRVREPASAFGIDCVEQRSTQLADGTKLNVEFHGERKQ